MLNLFSELEIINEDKILVSSNILPILIKNKKKIFKKVLGHLVILL